MNNKTAVKTGFKKYHTTSMRVPLFEVDLGQGVYHGNYFHLFEAARETFFRDIGYPYKKIMANELHLTIAKVTCAYRRSLRYDDLLEIQTGISRVRTRSLELNQKIYRDEDNGKKVLCTEADFNMVCVRFSGQVVSLPSEFVKSLAV